MPADRDPRSHAFDILRRVEEGGAFASILLDAREGGLADPRDAALLHETVLGVLRRRAVIDHVLAGASSRGVDAMDPATRTALRIGAYALLYLDRVPAFAAIDSAVELAKTHGRRAGAGFVNAVLRRVARQGEALRPAAPQRGQVEALALAGSHPAWWVRRAVERLGWDAAVALLEANNAPAPTVLRANERRVDAPALRALLAAEGVEVEPGRVVPGALRVVAGVPQRTASFRRGEFWLLDEGSQAVGELFGESLGPRVADLCAAPGTKAMQLAARLREGGLLVAADRHAGRMRRLVRGAARLGLQRHVAPLVADLTAPAPLAAVFDAVLVDAPCSGTGTLRRHPEIRWRLREGDLPALAARQRRILERGAAIVRPGGALVYAVCSMEPEEGVDVVASFLETHPAWRREAQIRTSPVDGPDGFQAERLRRIT